MEFLLTRRVKVSAQWSSEPLRRALARFDRDLEMTLNAGDLVPAGRIALVLARQLPPEQFIIDLQSADSMVIRAADDLAAVYALLHISRTALGILPLWFWNDQRFEKRELAAISTEHYTARPASVGLRGWSFAGGQLLEGWNAGAQDLNWEMALEALLRLGGNFAALPAGPAADLAGAMGLWRLPPAGLPLEGVPFDSRWPGRPPLYADSADAYKTLWAAAVEQHKHQKLIWRIGLPEQGGAILPDLAAAPLPRQGEQGAGRDGSGC